MRTSYTPKYRNKKTSVDGIRFDSKREANRYMELKLLERAGIIKGLKRQEPYILINKSSYGRAIKYVADFVYYEDDKLVVEDVKGVKTPVYKLKKRLMAERFGIEVKET